ncbi:cyclase-like protein 2 [Malania oleifera]|uniref:cyclase-like protein 2 n=1 Tax=Malania oleifera TaxID=397392 RepID=UPI0025AE07CA|nr:cyclase-like protein 2 [Malania oleifera]
MQHYLVYFEASHAHQYYDSIRAQKSVDSSYWLRPALSIHLLMFATMMLRISFPGRGHHKLTLAMWRTTEQPLLSLLSAVLLTIAAISSASTSSSDAYPSDAYPSAYGDGACSVSASDLTPVRREVYDDGRIFDISYRYTPDMPSWGSEDGLGQFLWLPKSMKNGSFANNSEMKLPTHTGTHVDAPGHVFDHYFDAGFDVDTLDLEVLNGPALLVDVPRDKNITAEVMKSLNIPRGVRRVLFRTLNTDRQLMFKKVFDTSYVGFKKDGAKWLVENTDIKLVGIDYLSVAAYDDLYPSHHVFLEGREIILVEGLKLDGVQSGIYDVHCLPLRLLGAEGSPIRCILIK